MLKDIPSAVLQKKGRDGIHYADGWTSLYELVGRYMTSQPGYEAGGKFRRLDMGTFDMGELEGFKRQLLEEGNKRCEKNSSRSERSVAFSRSDGVSDEGSHENTGDEEPAAQDTIATPTETDDKPPEDDTGTHAPTSRSRNVGENLAVATSETSNMRQDSAQQREGRGNNTPSAQQEGCEDQGIPDAAFFDLLKEVDALSPRQQEILANYVTDKLIRQQPQGSAIARNPVTPRE